MLERGNEPVKGGLPLFYYFTVQSYLLRLGGKVRFLYYFLALQSFELAMQDSDPRFYCTKTYYALYISDGSAQKMLTAFLTLEYTEK